MNKISSFLLGGIFLSSQITAQLAPPQDKFNYALELIKYAYVDTVDSKRLTEDALRAMVKDLDPHSVYIPVEEMREMNEPLVGKFEGIGVQFNIHEDTILVTQPIPGGPSEKLGIRAGDRIVKIDGKGVANVKITNNDVFKKLRGDKGTKVTVSIYRRGLTDLIDYTITRDQIPIFSLDAAYMVTPTIGYIKISRFADSTVDEFKAALAKLKKSGLESLILDLQGNGGGYLNRAVELSDEFLSEGKKIVFTRGRTSPPEDYNSSVIGGWEKGKLAILVDESSASASEIVSGAVQDWDRGLIIGRRSFGKGLVQKPFQLPDGSAIRLTVAHYYTPSGRNIQKPYKLGEEDEYELDFSNRVKSGELFSADSVKFEDSTNYYTNSKRLVKGGGGIMPDLFVPLDTSNNSTFYTDLLRKGVLGDFSLTYTDNHRAELLKKYPNIEAFKSTFVLDDKLFGEFLAAGDKAGVKKDDAGLKTSEAALRIQLKALLARNLWDTNAYFEVINDLNNALKKAIDAINGNTFEKMKIAAK
ncbi:MAG: S41 family peptidase [Bacteroidetes bacterium]|nr:S41 family peptidase [Bacteroidota bacterium]MBP6427059.1 S41 family peptidase [Bacteroidia bacterium]